MAKVYRNLQEMLAHLRGNVETIEPKEYEEKAEPSPAPKKRSRKKKDE